MYGIIGSGFGLYGYLPAVVKCTNHKVLLKEKSKEIFLKRPELQFCKDRIEWHLNEDDIYKNVETLILSVPPVVQYDIVANWISTKNIKNWILEKPLASTPEAATFLIDLFKKHQKKIIIGYSFLNTKWSKKLQHFAISEFSQYEKITIEWNFKSHHYTHHIENWKRYHNLGGGAIRFFGIHLIALISTMNYVNVYESNTKGFSDNDIYCWNAVFKKEGSIPIHIHVNCNNNDYNNFKIIGEVKNKSEVSIIDNLSPFDEDNGVTDLDMRVPILIDIIRSLDSIEDFNLHYDLYQRINNLWFEVEQKNINEIIA